MRRKRKYSKKKKIFILSSFLVVAFFMSVGFSLLSKTLEIEGSANLYASKGNLWYKIIHDYSSTNGGSFYESTYEPGKYVYMGNGNNNYIQIGTYLMRIVSVEPDHTIKVATIPNDPSNDTVSLFDSANNRDSSSTYCQTPENGCNAWAIQSVLNNGTVKNDSSLLAGMKQEYEALPNELKNIIAEHDFNIGFVTSGATFSQIISSEAEKTWRGHFGLLTLSDYLYPSNIASSTTIPTTASNNYLLNAVSGRIAWTLTGSTEDTSKVWAINYDGTQITRNASNRSETVEENTYNYIVIPALFLKDSLMYSSGDGSLSNPFTITTEQ